MDPAVLKELPPELLAEIESTMPLCERVKMNKRKRSTVNEKPKYAEVSSDDDFDPNGECESNYLIPISAHCKSLFIVQFGLRNIFLRCNKMMIKGSTDRRNTCICEHCYTELYFILYLNFIF